MTELPPVRRPPPASRLTRRRTAPPTREPPPSSPAMMRAAPDSRASLVRRTATPRDTTGAESITTSANAPHRNNTSAHHAARDGSRGRIIHSPSPSPRCAQSRGASVRVASTYATHPWLSVRSTIWRSRVAFPLPRAPIISVSRPRGNPPPASPASRASTPVGSVTTSIPAEAERGRGRGRRSTRDCGSIVVLPNRSCDRREGANKLSRTKTESKKEAHDRTSACLTMPLVHTTLQITRAT